MWEDRHGSWRAGSSGSDFGHHHVRSGPDLRALAEQRAGSGWPLAESTGGPTGLNGAGPRHAAPGTERDPGAAGFRGTDAVAVTGNQAIGGFAVSLRLRAAPPLLTGLLLARSPAHRICQQAPPGFDGYVRRVMQTFTVPGLSVAIVKDGRVVLAKGYGVRRMGDPTPVDARTRFGIASNTKLFTATAIALLVEEGKLDWDTPVSRYLPNFAMSDPYVTHEMTVRDLLVHRSGLGLGAGDLLWWPPSTYNRKEIAQRLRYIPLSTSFRSAYAYDNVLYLIAGELIEAVSGQAWEDFVRSRILRKIGMNDSDVRHSGATEQGNVAGTHAEVNDTVRPVAPFTSDNTNPAGGIMTGAADIAKWLLVQLDSGKVSKGTPLFSPASAKQLWREVTPVPIGDVPGGMAQLAHLRPTMAGYALGLS